MGQERGQRERNDGIFVKILNRAKNKYNGFRALSKQEKRRKSYDFLFSNAMYILIFVAVVVIAIIEPRFISVASIINVISLTAAKLPIALGIGGAIVLTGTDISAGRAVGLTACVAASLLQSTSYCN